jgi:hypothetical protein
LTVQANVVAHQSIWPPLLLLCSHDPEKTMPSTATGQNLKEELFVHRRRTPSTAPRPEQDDDRMEGITKQLILGWYRRERSRASPMRRQRSPHRMICWSRRVGASQKSPPICDFMLTGDARSGKVQLTA